jgi:hypothetical protein
VHCSRELRALSKRQGAISFPRSLMLMLMLMLALALVSPTRTDSCCPLALRALAHLAHFGR